MDFIVNVKVVCDYFISKQNIVFLFIKDFGKRKFIYVGSSGSLKFLGKQKLFEEGILFFFEDSNFQVLIMKSVFKQWVYFLDKFFIGYIVYNVKVRRLEVKVFYIYCNRKG